MGAVPWNEPSDNTVLYDLSQPIENGMSYFPGDPEPYLAPYPASLPWRVSDLHIGSHSGTHLDAPAHIGHETTTDQVRLERLIGPGVVVDVTGKQAGERIGLGDVSLVAQAHLQRGRWAIFYTGWSRHWGTPAYLAHPSLDPTLTRTLVAWGVDLVAVDMLNPDDTAKGASIVHEILLGAGVVIVENLTGLDRLSVDRVYTFAFLPLKLAGADGAPLRAVAWEEPEPETEDD